MQLNQVFKLKEPKLPVERIKGTIHSEPTRYKPIESGAWSLLPWGKGRNERKKCKQRLHRGEVGDSSSHSKWNRQPCQSRWSDKGKRPASRPSAVYPWVNWHLWYSPPSLTWQMLTLATERRQADGPWPYREKIFDASHLWHDWFSFSSPSLWEVARAGSLRPGAPWPPTCGRCEAGNRWRQKPKKSIGPVSQGRVGRLLKTQSRHAFAAWCGSTAHLRTQWISPFPDLFIHLVQLCTSSSETRNPSPLSQSGNGASES